MDLSSATKCDQKHNSDIKIWPHLKLELGMSIQQTGLRGGFVEQLCQTLAGQQSVTKFIVMIVRILVTLTAAAKH